ncbi:hypothetical protein AB0P17_39905, partial [Streptomyces sp. NPDC088124]|uniref:hypothetical protein n=1 Tax=Streptomyces sp. NPDC088124 TaxID=3154654 RepID=UPI003415311A
MSTTRPAGRRRPAHLKRPATAALALSAIALMSLTAGCSQDQGRCGPAPVEDVFGKDLYGTYAGPHEARLTLRDNGDNTLGFTVTGWPESSDPEILGKNAPAFDGQGTWRIEDDPDQGDRVRLQFEDEGR